jgi:hypothetical protein
MFKSLSRETGITAVVFSLQNVNLSDNTVYGIVITGGQMKQMKTELPLIVFNLATQISRSDIKLLRRIAEIENLVLVNSTNRFSQSAIMEMLVSNESTQSCILPYNMLNIEDMDYVFSQANNFIVKPDYGSNQNKLIYARQSEYGFDLFSRSGKQYYHRMDLQSLMHTIAGKKAYLFIKAPELVIYNDQLLVVRTYMQKCCNAHWKVLLKETFPQNIRIFRRYDNDVETLSREITECIGCFNPDNGICYIDFVISVQGKPFFLNFGGWDNRLLQKNISRNVKAELFENILEYRK